MRVPQLKQLLQSRGVVCRECVEKADYVAKLKEAFGVASGGAREEL